MKVFKNRLIGIFLMVVSVCASAATYPSAGNGTEPNVWTRNYSGVLAAAKVTGYPVFLIIVNSAGCGHCSAMMDKTVNTAEFEAMDRELTFYKVIMDQAYSGSSSDYRTCLSRYKGYLNYNMFPAVVVARNDGTAYGGFGNITTDKRGVTSDIRAMIVALAAEQGADGVTPVPRNDTPSSETTSGASATAWASKHKGKSTGIVFDANQGLSATCVVKVSARGKVNVTSTGVSGKETVKGDVLLSSENEPMVNSGGLNIFYDDSMHMWRGTWNGRKVFASGAQETGYDGLYTAGAESGDGSRAGYFSVTVRRDKGKVSGKVNGKNSVSANGTAILLPASLIAEQLDEWDIGEDLLFVPVVKRGKVSGGVTLSKHGVVRGFVSAFGVKWKVSGGKWSSTVSLRLLNGMVLSVAGLGVEFPVVVTGDSKVEAGANDFSAKVRVTVRTGVFKGSLKTSGGRVSVAGVLVSDGHSIVGRGNANGSGMAYPVVIDSPCGGDCSAR